jgi:hypothetical protein
MGTSGFDQMETLNGIISTDYSLGIIEIEC